VTRTPSRSVAPARRRAATFLVVLALVGGALPVSAAESARRHPDQAQPPDPYYPDLGNRGYDVQHYDLGLAYDPETTEVDGDTRIRATATERLRRFFLDFVGLEVEAVSVGGKRVRFERRGGELVVRPRRPIAASADFDVRIRYAGVPEPGTFPGFNAPNGWLTDPDGSVVTINEPDGARRWFPANDHPTDKASYTFRVDVPSSLTAIANGELQAREAHGDRTTFVWEAAAPMATYLAQLAIGDAVLEDAPPVDGVVIRHAFGPDVRESAALAAAETPAMLTFLASWFGPYPFSTYGVLAPDGGLRGLAFEAQTFSLFAPDVFRAGRGSSPVLAHELAHQWFGNWVSPASWQETWLNEGFATYAEWLWSDHALGVPIAQNAQAALREARADPDAGAADPGRDGMFSNVVYGRGALTLHALRLTVGDDAFVRILRTYLDRFGGKTASTDAFVDVASGVAGHDLESFFASWLGPGPVPDLPAGTPGSTPPPPPPPPPQGAR